MKKILIFMLFFSFCNIACASDPFEDSAKYIADALKKGDYYKNQGLYDNAIIWYQRAAAERENLYGTSGYIPVDIADTYLLKGNCTKPFDLYRKAFQNVGNEHISNLEWAAPQIENKINYAQRYCAQHVWNNQMRNK